MNTLNEIGISFCLQDLGWTKEDFSDLGRNRRALLEKKEDISDIKKLVTSDERKVSDLRQKRSGTIEGQK